MEKPTLSIFTGSESLGFVFKENIQLSNNFFESSIPFTDDSGYFASNIRGKKRLISVQGMTYGEGFAGSTQTLQLAEFVERVDEWVNTSGLQDSETYTDGLGISREVKCVDWTYSIDYRKPNRLLYSFIFIRV